MTETPPILPKGPATTDDFASLIADAHAAGSQVQLVGSGSMPLSSFDPARTLQPISSLRLNKVLEHAVEDMTVIVHAGITLEALQKQLAWRNQWLPIDPPALRSRGPGQRTLAGLIATQSLGPLRFGVGDFRLLIMGLKWVDGSGTLVKAGGRTVKNVAGYASHRLMIGAAGTLGALAEITLRTFSRPADEQCVLFFCDSAPRAEALLAEIFTSATAPAYLQLIGRQGFRDNPLQLPTSRMILVAGFLDRPATCASQIEMLRNLPAAQGVESISQTAAQAGRLRLWLTTEPGEDTDLGFRIFGQSSQAAALIESVESLAKKMPASDTNSTYDPSIWLVSEAGNGIIRGSAFGVDRPAFLHELSALIHASGAALQIVRGSPSSTPPPTPDPASPFARLKAQLDPQNTFGLPLA